MEWQDKEGILNEYGVSVGVGVKGSNGWDVVMEEEEMARRRRNIEGGWNFRGKWGHRLSWGKLGMLY